MNALIRRRFEVWLSTVTGWWFVYDARTPGELTAHGSTGLRRRYFDTRAEAEHAVQVEVERVCGDMARRWAA